MKILYLILSLSLVSLIVNAQVWTPINERINGEYEGEYSGYSTAYSSDGTIVAIGALRNSEIAEYSGQVRVYRNHNGAWEQIGNDINGDVLKDYMGYSVSLSSDGSILAVGATGATGAINDNEDGIKPGFVRVFYNNNDAWTQIGSDLIGGHINDWFGSSVSLNADGTILAIGSPKEDSGAENAGQVAIFQNINNEWIQIGQSLNGSSSYADFGNYVSLNADGTIVAIASQFDSEMGNRRGRVSVYSNNNGTWEQIGQNLYGDENLNFFGTSINLNSNGNILAVGAPYNDASANWAGQAKVFRNNNGTWEQIGGDILGIREDALCGKSVSLSDDGSIFAVSSPSRLATSGNGYVSVYQNISDEWVLLADEIVHYTNEFGSAISLDSDGTKIAVGHIYGDEPTDNVGAVFIYSLLMPPSINTQPLNQTDVCVGENAIFYIEGDDIEEYHWQVSTNSGSSWMDIFDNSIYSGTETDSLIISTNSSLNHNLYRAYVSNAAGTINSNFAELSFETEVPFIEAFDDRIVLANNNCEAIIANYIDSISLFDNCTANNNLILNQYPAPLSSISGAVNTITIEATDQAGNFSQINFNIGVKDEEPPVFTCVDNQEIQGLSYTVNGNEFDPFGLNDNCSIASVSNDFNNSESLDGAILPEGTTHIEWSITDLSDNLSYCSFEVLVSTSLKVTNYETNNFVIFPNPTTGRINLSFQKEQKNVSVQILNIIGQIVQKEIFRNTKAINFDINPPKGIYFIEVSTIQGFYRIEKVIKD